MSNLEILCGCGVIIAFLGLIVRPIVLHMLKNGVPVSTFDPPRYESAPLWTCVTTTTYAPKKKKIAKAKQEVEKSKPTIH